ncbi:MAG: phage head-tail adapter protein [Clostridiales bacterium]|nr:phage head-tail adapter protein [Clostridiales bacterium]
MNKEWSALNKTMQSQIKKKGTFEEGIGTLLTLRDELMNEVLSWREKYKREDFDAMPFINADGYHCKNIAYSIWHVFRIEDIVAHDLIAGDDEVLFTGDYQKRIKSPIISTGNELHKEKIAEFTRQLDLDELYAYAQEVKKSTESILSGMPFETLKIGVSDESRTKLESLGVVSNDEDAIWLIDYWCGKDVRGLIQMPFSRHWIMHIEACLRIMKKL